MSSNFKRSLVNECGRRGERLSEFLFHEGRGKDLFRAHESVVARGCENDESIGVFTTDDGSIKKNDYIFNLKRGLYEPLSSAISLSNAIAKAPDFVRRAKEIAPGFETHTSMALNFLLESPQYRSSCPLKLSVPLCWTGDQVALLMGTCAFDRVKTRRTFMKNAHHAIFGGENALPFELYAWAISQVLSRALKTDTFYSFIPGVDLLNHNHHTKANCEIRLVQGVEGVEVVAVATRDILNQNEEITISYGNELSNDEFLRKYGFCVENNENDYIDLLSPTGKVSLSKKTDFADFTKEHIKRVLEKLAEKRQILNEVSFHNTFLSEKEESNSQWINAIKILRKGEIEIIDFVENALHL